MLRFILNKISAKAILQKSIITYQKFFKKINRHNYKSICSFQGNVQIQHNYNKKWHYDFFGIQNLYEKCEQSWNYNRQSEKKKWKEITQIRH